MKLSLDIVAMLLAFTGFGCVAVRAPVGGLSSVVDVRAIDAEVAAPQVELWVESNGQPSAGELAAASQEASAGLRAALARYQFGDSFGPTTLYARERGVTRTDARRREQVAAGVAIGVGVAAVAAVMVLAIVSGGKGGGHGSASAGHAHAGAAPVAHAAGGAGAAGSAVGVARHAPSVGAVQAGAFWPHHGHFGYDGWGQHGRGIRFVDVWVNPQLYGSFYENAGLELDGERPPPFQDEEDAPEVSEPPRPLTDLGLLPAVVLDGRGTFDGDRTVLQLDLVDRKTGRLLWTRTVAKDVDPCDGGDVARLVEVALRGQGWARARR